jgi:very-short-patch-repair endonuclease
MNELDKTMYYGAKASTMQAARILRSKMTIPEKLLWEKLRNKQIDGFRFRRQHPIDFFIADFYCHEVRLVVEVDGEIHDQQKEYDDGRSAEMERNFIKVLRFTNSEVEKDIDTVIRKIQIEVSERFKSPPWGI